MTDSTDWSLKSLPPGLENGDVDLLMRMIEEADDEANDQANRYAPYTPPHSDDACSPPYSTASGFGALNELSPPYMYTPSPHPSTSPPSSVHHPSTSPPATAHQKYTSPPTSVVHQSAVNEERFRPTKKRRHSPDNTDDYQNILFNMDSSHFTGELENVAFRDIGELEHSEFREMVELDVREIEAQLHIKEEVGSPRQSEERVDDDRMMWRGFDADNSCSLCTDRRQSIPAPQYNVSADKGFTYSSHDNAFINHRKNHFQISVVASFPTKPTHFTDASGVLRRLDGFTVHIYGVKVDSLRQRVLVEQSHTDRRKRPYQPVNVNIGQDGNIRSTISRLHFSETTQNNQRKRGLPNPDQKYFRLVAALHVTSGGQSYPLVASISDRFVVRASNPKQFENESEQQWQPGTTPSSMYYKGRVGINTSAPEESLTVHGNIRVTGQVLQPSDARVKDKIREVNYGDQLKTVSGLRLHQYQYNQAYASTVDIHNDQKTEIGVIAQEVRELMPDAVVDVGDLKLSNGEKIENLLVVNKDRIFLESVGAVKELCKLTENMESRVCHLENRDRKLAKLARKLGGSQSSGSSCSSGLSKASSAIKLRDPPPSAIPTVDQGKCCLMYRVKQEVRCRRAIIGLLAIIFVLALICVSSITAAVLYGERSKSSEQVKSPNSDMIYIQSNDGQPATTTAASRSAQVQHDTPPLSTVEVAVNCTMSLCRQSGCCGKVGSDQQAATQPVTEPAIKEATPTTVSKHDQKMTQTDVARAQSAPGGETVNTNKQKILPDTSMMADASVAVKDQVKVSRRRRSVADWVTLDLGTDCSKTSVTSSSTVYLCPASGLSISQTVIFTMRSRCKLDVTCNCQCQQASLQTQTDCSSSSLLVTVYADSNCHV